MDTTISFQQLSSFQFSNNNWILWSTIETTTMNKLNLISSNYSFYFIELMQFEVSECSIAFSGIMEDFTVKNNVFTLTINILHFYNKFLNQKQKWQQKQYWTINNFSKSLTSSMRLKTDTNLYPKPNFLLTKGNLHFCHQWLWTARISLQIWIITHHCKFTVNLKIYSAS